MSTGFHFLGFGAWSYFADRRTPSGNLTGHATPAFDIFRFEFNIQLSGPLLSYLLLSFKVVSLSGYERVAYGTVQTAIRGHLRHNCYFLLLSIKVRWHIAGQCDEFTADLRRLS